MIKLSRGIFLAFAMCLGVPAFAGINTQDVQTLREIFQDMVTKKMQIEVEPDESEFMKKALENYSEIKQLTSPEFVVVVNRHPKRQNATVVLTDGKGVQVIGSTKVSTGDLNRKLHFATPLGIFENKRENGNFRAEGTKNSNGIRGYGAKGMRVFDFGWQPSVASWGKRHAAEIRLLMHATDPDVLEARLGTTASQGCVRIPASLNTFMDEYGVLDKNYSDGAWVLSKDKKLSAYDGRYMIIIEYPPVSDK